MIKVLVQLSLGKTDKLVVSYLLLDVRVIVTIFEGFKVKKAEWLPETSIKNVYIPLVCSKKKGVNYTP